MCYLEVLDPGETTLEHRGKRVTLYERSKLQKEWIMKDAALSTVLTLRVVMLCQLIHLALVPPLFARYYHTL